MGEDPNLPTEPYQDSDGNGILDIEDYVFGNYLGTPRQPTYTLEMEGSGAGLVRRVRFTYAQNKAVPGDAVRILFTQDFINWVDADTSPEVSRSDLGDGRDLVERIVELPSSIDRLFYRINVRYEDLIE